MKGGRYGGIRKDAASRVWKGEENVKSVPNRHGTGFFLLKSIKILSLNNALGLLVGFCCIRPCFQPCKQVSVSPLFSNIDVRYLLLPFKVPIIMHGKLINQDLRGKVGGKYKKLTKY